MVFEIILGFVALVLAIAGLAVLNRFNTSSSVGGGSELSGPSLSFEEEAYVAGSMQKRIWDLATELYSLKKPEELLGAARYLRKLFKKYAPITQKLLERMESTIKTYIKKYEPLKEALKSTYSLIQNLEYHEKALEEGIISGEEFVEKGGRVARYHQLGRMVAEDIDETRRREDVAKQFGREPEEQAPTEQQVAP